MMMGEWLQAYGPMPTCFIVRNPVPVVLSHIKMIADPMCVWEQLRMLGQLEPVLGEYWSLFEKRPQSEAAAVATVWAAQHYVVLQQFSRHNDWSLFKYEDICRDPLGGISQVTRSLGLPFGLVDRLRVWATTLADDRRFHGVRRKTSAMVEGWRQSASPDLVKDVSDVCSKFEFPIYSEQELRGQSRGLRR
jgi:hypothetical protein